MPRKETRAEHTLWYVSISATAEWCKIYKLESYKGIKIRANLGNFVPRKETRAEHTLWYVSISATAEWCKIYKLE